MGRTMAENAGKESSRPDAAGAQADAGKGASRGAGAKRQAVLVIHGMGEQRPMDTLRGFVRAVWERDPSLVPDRPGDDRETEIWSKPDAPGEAFELRRLTTRQSKSAPGETEGFRTDFYEFYWAHLMSGNGWEHFTEWLRALLLRRFDQVPRGVFHAWLLLWAVAILAILFGLAAVIPHDALFWQWPVLNWFTLLPKWASAAIGLAGGFLANRFLLPYFGDVARYVTATPHNIARRNDIRSAGIELIEAIDDPDRYRRVIVVAHSLGAIIAYDILSIYWARHHREHAPFAGRPRQPALASVSRAATAAHAGEPLDLGQYRGAQRALFDEQRRLGNPWLITDFVTLGCPLTHAGFLLAKDRPGLVRKIEERILPTCPPYPELDNAGKRAIAYLPTRPFAGRFPMRTLHHAAPFGPTRWTNIYDPHRFILFGDIISGPCAKEFGPGVKDVPVTVKGRRGRIFTHTEYWWWDDKRHRVEGPPEHLKRLREALNLLDAKEGGGAPAHETAPNDGTAA